MISANGSSSCRVSRQPKQRRDEDSLFEKQIKTSIRKMQENVRSVTEQLDRVNRGTTLLSNRNLATMDASLSLSRALAQETDDCFQRWSLSLSGESLAERSRKKFSYEKLRQAFEEEAGRLKSVARKLIEVQKREAMKKSTRPGENAQQQEDIECRPLCEMGEEYEEEEDSESRGLLLGNQDQSSQDVLIQQMISQEREEGIRRIQNQMQDVNQIFKDLGQICAEQGAQLESIESCVAEGATSSKQAVVELRKAADRQKAGRDHICCLLIAGLLLLCLVLATHLDAFGSSLLARTAALEAAVKNLKPPPPSGEEVVTGAPPVVSDGSSAWGFQADTPAVAASKIAYKVGKTLA